MDTPTTTPLTPGEIADLPDGTPIIVIWAPGDIPFRYTLKCTPRGPIATSTFALGRGHEDHLTKNLYVFVDGHPQVWDDPDA